MFYSGEVVLIGLIFSALIGGCAPDGGKTSLEQKQKTEEMAQMQQETFLQEIEKGEEQLEKIQLVIQDQTFSVILEDTKAAKEFCSMLPMTLEMKERNGNEKYANLSENLTTEASVPEKIQEGDLMLYGSDCVVLFYEPFSTAYSYTPLGKVEDREGLQDAVGKGNVTVSFQVEGE